MTDRYSGLKKVPKQPALRLLALANMKLDTELSVPAAAPVDAVLAELEQAEAWPDLLRVMVAALPVREGVWWACLGVEDVLGGGEAAQSPCLKAARDWVYKPNDATREAARRAAEQADPSDPADLCAGAVAMSDGTLGPGDYARYAAPPGGAQTMILTAVANGIGADGIEDFEAHLQHVIDRGLDIARGGNGRIANGAATIPMEGTT
jgi:hypothetical protein